MMQKTKPSLPVLPGELLGGGRYAEVFAAGAGKVIKVARETIADLDGVTNAIFLARGVVFNTGSVGQWQPTPNDVIDGEARALAAMRHPAMVQVLEAGHALHEGTERSYLVLEALSGKTWREQLARVSPKHVLRVAEVLAETGLHGDVKPENLFLDGTGNVRIIDPSSGVLERDGAKMPLRMLLTPDYNPSFAISDVPSLGVLLLEVMTGQQPLSFATDSNPLLPVSAALAAQLDRKRAVGQNGITDIYPRMKLAPPSPMQALALSCLGLRYDGITLDVADAPASVAAFRDSLSRL